MPTTLDRIDGLALAHVKRLDEHIVADILLDQSRQWMADEDVTEQVDRILTQLRGRSRPLWMRVADELPWYRTMRSGTRHPDPSRLSADELALCRERTRERVDDLVECGLIAAWEGDAFLGDLDGLSPRLLAAEAGCNSWALQRTSLRVRRLMIREATADAAVGEIA